MKGILAIKPIICAGRSS